MGLARLLPAALIRQPKIRRFVKLTRRRIFLYSVFYGSVYLYEIFKKQFNYK